MYGGGREDPAHIRFHACCSHRLVVLVECTKNSVNELINIYRYL